MLSTYQKWPKAACLDMSDRKNLGYRIQEWAKFLENSYPWKIPGYTIILSCWAESSKLTFQIKSYSTAGSNEKVTEV